MKRPETIHGRSGLIVIDESHARALSTAINTLPHSRDALATQPMDLLPDQPDWSDRLLDAVSHYGLYVFAGIAALALLGVFMVGVLR